MPEHRSRIVVGITACHRQLDPHPYHIVGEKYVDAVVHGAGAMPILLPPVGDRIDAGHLSEIADGIVLTGSPSNVEPHHYGGSQEDSVPPHDPKRDATTLPMIRELVARGVALLAICRGYQEVNVAYGGTLTPKLQDLPGHLDHRENPDLPLQERYGPCHEVRFTKGGQMQSIAASDSAMVNSLHQQGINRLGNGLSVEAKASDGVIEAFRVTDAPNFALGVQWHPEWRVTENELSMRLFGAFADACRSRRGS